MTILLIWKKIILVVMVSLSTLLEYLRKEGHFRFSIHLFPSNSNIVPLSTHWAEIRLIYILWRNPIFESDSILFFLGNFGKWFCCVKKFLLSFWSLRKTEIFHHRKTVRRRNFSRIAKGIVPVIVRKFIIFKNYILCAICKGKGRTDFPKAVFWKKVCWLLLFISFSFFYLLYKYSVVSLLSILNFF